MFSDKFTLFFVCVQLFMTDWLGVIEMRNMRHRSTHANQILVILFCFRFAQTSSVSFSALYVPNKNSASRSWCFSAVCGWVSSPVMSLYYRLSALLHTDPRSAPVCYSGQIERSHSQENEESETAPRWSLWFLLSIGSTLSCWSNSELLTFYAIQNNIYFE